MSVKNRFGNPQNGLLYAIINYFRRSASVAHYVDVCQHILRAGFCRRGVTPERTVCSYLSSNPHIFNSVGRGLYRLRSEWLTP
jgi:hypothetical protein